MTTFNLKPNSYQQLSKFFELEGFTIVATTDTSLTLSRKKEREQIEIEILKESTIEVHKIKEFLNRADIAQEQYFEQIEIFAKKVKAFFYYRASLCDKLVREGEKNIFFQDICHERQLLDCDFSIDLSSDAYTIACSALDALSSYQISLLNSGDKKNKVNQDSFSSFIGSIETRLNKVCFKFLVYFIQKKNPKSRLLEILKKYENESLIGSNVPTNCIYEYYEDEDEDEDEDEERRGASHSRRSDTVKERSDTVKKNRQTAMIDEEPTVEELVKYCMNHGVYSETEIRKELEKATYARLIYKFYRCSFVHNFRQGKYVKLFKNSSQTSRINSDNIQSKISVIYDKDMPCLDIDIALFKTFIEKATDKICKLIIENQCFTMPYTDKDEIDIKCHLFK